MLDPTLSPHDADLVLEHCDMTGSYITADGGRSWRMFNLGTVVSAFTFDPGDPDVIYAGNFALWRSADRGKTWRMVYPDPARGTRLHPRGDHADPLLTSEDPAFTMTGYRIAALAVDPSDSRRLHVVWARRTGWTHCVSEDGGRTWRETERDRGGQVHSLFSQADGRTYVLTTDGVCVLAEDEWVRREGPPGGAMHYATAGPREAGEPLVYALVSPEGGWEPYCQRVFSSKDGGAHWREVSEEVRRALPPIDGRTRYEFRAVACQAGQPNTAYLGFALFGLAGGRHSSGSGVLSTGIEHSGIVKTTDGGESWEVVFSEKAGPAANLRPSWIEQRKPDTCVWLDAPVSIGVAPGNGDVCYATDLFRTYRTVDGGRTWETVNSVDKGQGRWTTRGLDVTTCYGVHFDPFDRSRMFISYTDIGLFRSEDRGESWRGAVEGIPEAWRNTTYWIEFDPEAKGRMWGAFAGPHDLPRPKMWRHREVDTYTGGVAISEDGGQSWQLSNEGMPETAATHLLLDPTSPVGARTLYVCGFGRGVFKSVDNGRTWRPKSEGIEGEAPFAWRLVRTTAGTLYLLVARRSDDGSIGTAADGALYRSMDAAESWQKMSLPDGCNGPVGLALDPRDDRRMYLAAWGRQGELDDTGGGVYVTEDAGESWRLLLGESQHVYDVTVDPDQPQVLYACGFDQAAYRSVNGGEDWERIRGYDFKWGHRVVLDPQDRSSIYICTYGGSLWHGPAAGDPQAVEDAILSVNASH